MNLYDTPSLPAARLHVPPRPLGLLTSSVLLLAAASIALQAPCQSPKLPPPPRIRTANSFAESAPHTSSSSAGALAPLTVSLINGTLVVRANGADLPQILRRIAEIGGMKIEGAIHSSRVDGVYGPGDPADVLNQLLVGSGYNYMMVGETAEGTPRELSLFPKNGKPSPPDPASRNSVAAVRADQPEPEEVAAPGAILHVPPPPPENTQERVQQQMQRLQQMHDSLAKQAAAQAQPR